MRMLFLAVETISALLLISTLETVSARRDAPLVVARHHESLREMEAQRRVAQRNPQAGDQGGKQVYQPYDYGSGPSPDDNDATTTSVISYASSLTSVPDSSSAGTSGSPRGSLTGSTSETSGLNIESASTNEPQDGEGGYPTGSTEESDSSPVLETTVINTGRETSTTDDEHVSNLSSGLLATTYSTSSDKFSSQESSQAVESDVTATLAGASEHGIPSSDLTRRPSGNISSSSFTSSRPLNTTLQESTTENLGLSTPGNLETPVTKPTGSPTWMMLSSRGPVSLTSIEPPYPTNSTHSTSLLGSGTGFEAASESTSPIPSSQSGNATISSAHSSSIIPAFNTTGSGISNSGTGQIIPTVQGTDSSNAPTASPSLSGGSSAPTESPPFPAGKATITGNPSGQSTAAALNTTDTASTAASPASSDSLTNRPDDGQTMFPGGWNQSGSQASSPPFPTQNTTSGTLSPGTGVPEAEANSTASTSSATATSFSSGNQSLFSASSNVTAGPSLTASPPPFPLPNITVTPPSGTVVSMSASDQNSAASETLAGTIISPLPLSSSTLSPNYTSIRVSRTILPAPLPPITLENTTITFPPVTSDLPTISVPPPFPLPNITASSLFPETGTGAPSVPPSLVTSDSVPNATILPLPSQSSILGVSIPATSTLWPNATITGASTTSATASTPMTSQPSFPTYTSVPMSLNVTAPSNTTEPDSTGTLFGWPEESEGPLSNSTSASANVTASSTGSLSAGQPPFPLSNSTAAPGPTALPSVPIPLPPPIPIPGVNSTTGGSLIISRTVLQEGTETASPFSSLLTGILPTSNYTLIMSRTITEETTEDPPTNSTLWEGSAQVTQTSVPPSEVMPFPNATAAANGTGEISGTLVRPTSVTNVTMGTSIAIPKPVTVTATPVTITAHPLESQPCVTLTITRGNITEEITKTITEPHSGFSGSFSLAGGDETTSGGLSLTGEFTAPCNSTTKTRDWKPTTSCTLSRHWLNNTLTILPGSTAPSSATTSNSEPFGDLSLISVSATSGGFIYSETLGLYPSSVSSSNLTFVPIPNPTTLLTSTRSQQNNVPFLREPTTTASDEPLPSNPNYPWGGEGPLHRHQNLTALGTFGGNSEEVSKSKRAWWSQMERRLRRWQDGGIQRGQVVAHGKNDGEGSDWDLDEHDLVDGK